MTPHNGSFLRSLAEWLIVIVIACAATFLIRSFIIEPYVVPTGSMESTIEIGDQVLAEKVTVELGRECARVTSSSSTTPTVAQSTTCLSSASSRLEDKLSI